MRLYENHLELTLSVSKIDSFRKSIRLTVSDTNDEVYAVRALRYLFQQYSSPPEISLFNISSGKAFSRDLITKNLRLALHFNDFKGHYSRHSFRRGAATSARHANLSEDEIMLLERWKSDSYRLYIVIHPTHILAASRRQQHVQM